MTKTIAVLDIGKTNKKVFIYNEQLEVLDSAYESFPEYTENGINFEQTADTFLWFKNQLKKFSSAYNIQAISVSTQGATFACTDDTGKLTLPVLAYTTDPGQTLHDDFYREYGSIEKLQKETCTPNLGLLINPAKNIYFIKKNYPEAWQRTRHIIHYPQYFSFLLTGEICAEHTYLGCHNYLWDFKNMHYSQTAEDLGAVQRLPKRIIKPWDKAGVISQELAAETGLSAQTIVTAGIHDSNASLLPYLIKNKSNFILNSTGTWCVLMHPAKEPVLTEEDLGKIVFYNLSAFSRPVKTAIFLGGMEFEKYSGFLRIIHGHKPYPGYNQGLYQKIINEKKYFILPELMSGTGQFPGCRPAAVENNKRYETEGLENGSFPEFFRDYETAHAVLNISLAVQTRIALERCGMQNGYHVFTEGGFRKNSGYNAVLKSFYDNSEFFLTGLSEASAFGAALLAVSALKNTSPDTLGSLFEIETIPVTAKRLDGIDSYLCAFKNALENR
ncbi:MAG: hypothetical protein A2096_14015 [Spirochaetes bacterium GWF1_41_5]|nr:MAG: hypothetical protein A2096_14015 [Spirochaetes bacterium GWF1_41_5]HBE01333.1 carbohydrate kinase [Spirochaetia bacterium]